MTFDDQTQHSTNIRSKISSVQFRKLIGVRNRSVSHCRPLKIKVTTAIGFINIDRKLNRQKEKKFGKPVDCH